MSRDGRTPGEVQIGLAWYTREAWERLGELAAERWPCPDRFA